MSSSGYSSKKNSTENIESGGFKHDSASNKQEILFDSNFANTSESQNSPTPTNTESKIDISNQDPSPESQNFSGSNLVNSEDNNQLSNDNLSSSFEIPTSENSGESLNSEQLSSFMNNPRGLNSDFKLKRIEEIQSIRSEPRRSNAENKDCSEISISLTTESSVHESEISQGDWKQKNLNAISKKFSNSNRKYDSDQFSSISESNDNSSISSVKRQKRQVLKSSSSDAYSQNSKSVNFENVHSEISDVPAVRKVKNKIENLLYKHEIDSPINRQGVRIQYLDESSPSPRKRQKVAPIFLDESEPELGESEASISSRIDVLTVERNAANIADSEISDIGLVDFDTPKTKFTKSKVKDALYSDEEAQFYYNKRDIIDNDESNISLNIQSSKVESEDSDENITNEIFEKAQKQIEKYAIKDKATDANGQLFNLNLPNSDEEGQLLLDLQKNAIVLSSSDSQTLNEEEEDVEMIGNTFEHRNVRFFELSDLSSDYEDKPAESSQKPLNETENDDDQSSQSEIPLLVDKLIAPRVLVSPKSQKMSATPSPRPKYTDNEVLTITVLEAKDLPKANAKLQCDPYIIFTIKGQKDYKKTKTCKTGKKGVYSWDNEEISFVLVPTETNVLTMKVKDEDRFAGDVDVCSYEYLISQLQIGQTMEKWFHLRPKKVHDNGGKLLLRLNLERELMPIPPHSPSKRQPFMEEEEILSLNESIHSENISEEEEPNDDDFEPSSTLSEFENPNDKSDTPDLEVDITVDDQ